MSYLLDIAGILQKERLTARLESSPGPVVLVLARSMLGKMALSKYLINHACKHGGKPLFIDLDHANNLVGVRGSIAAGYCERKFPEDFFEEKDKIIFYAGNDFIPEFYKAQAMRLADQALLKLDRESARNSSGAVVALPSTVLA